MLTPKKFAPEWRRFAEAHGLAVTETPPGPSPKSLSMKGRVDGVEVSVDYEPRREHRDASPDAASPTSMQDVLGHVLVLRAAASRPLGGKITVGLDPTPTFRKVASLAGGGDPTVGDKEFDDRFLLEGDESHLRAALTDAVRAGLKALAKVPVSMQLAVDGARVTVTCPTVVRGPETLAAALQTLVAACT